MAAGSYALPPDRLDRWLQRWADAHGGIAETRTDGATVSFTAADGEVVDCEAPFGPVQGDLLAHVGRERTVGVLLVLVADCLPVLFAAPAGRAVGAAHAGWRGLCGGVLEATLREVCAAGVCAPEEVSVWLGACIGPRRFEVGPDVLEAFGAADHTTVAACFVPLRPGKWLADLVRLARLRLAGAGVTQLSGGTWCTVEEPSRFYSFRRDGVTGRMAAAAWIAGRRTP